MARSIWHNGGFDICRRYTNGIIVGLANGTHLAIHQSVLKRAHTLHPVVGKYQADRGWIYPTTIEKKQTLQIWLKELTGKSRLDWEAMLQSHIKQEKRVKIAVEDWSTEDLSALKRLGWLVGFSAAAPLWRIYAYVPKTVWDSTDEQQEMPALDGQVRSLRRFGAILNLEQHRCHWK